LKNPSESKLFNPNAPYFSTPYTLTPKAYENYMETRFFFFVLLLLLLTLFRFSKIVFSRLFNKPPPYPPLPDYLLPDTSLLNPIPGLFLVYYYYYYYYF
jgi:hypothetical protein